MSDEETKPESVPDAVAPVHMYTLQTTAPYKVAREVAIAIAQRFGYMALLSEVPDDEVVIVRPIVWGPARWWAVIFVLGASPWFFRDVWQSATNLQGFGFGFITAAIVVLAFRHERAI